jgi:hypothetical protein
MSDRAVTLIVRLRRRRGGAGRKGGAVSRAGGRGTA